MTGKVFISCAANDDLLGQNILVLIKVATEKVLYNIYFTLAMSLYDLKLQNLHKVEFSMEKF